MLFQSIEFMFVFLPIVFCGYHILRVRGSAALAIAFLIVCSAAFYAAHEPKYLLLLFSSAFINYLVGWHVSRTHSAVGLAGGIAFNLILLGYFKYAGFAVWAYNETFSGSVVIPDITLPLAISFFTFQQIAYLVDVYRYGPVPGGLLRYALFVVFFPQLVAGPIVHHAEMIPQFEKTGRFARLRMDVAVGFTIFTIGLIKKTIFADSAGVFADIIFGRAAEGIAPALFESWIGGIAFGLQIYFDFSGYSDMAVGLARLFGVRLPVNFFSPYRSASIIEFWRRWHITLSRFLRDYVYYPLGGNRKGVARRYTNLIVVMLLGGLWHGAGVNFIFWGALHGAFLMVNHGWRVIAPKLSSAISRPVYWTLTLLAVTMAWVPFRAHDFDSTMLLWSGMVGSNGVSVPRTAILAMGDFGEKFVGLGLRIDSDVFRALFWSAGVTNGAIVATGLIVALFFPNTYQWVRRLKPVLAEQPIPEWTLPQALLWRPTLPWGVLIAAFFCTAIYYQAAPSAFLYFQF